MLNWRIGMVLGFLFFVWGITGVAIADTDSTCYMKAYKNAFGNWIGTPTTAINCNTTDCPPGVGGPGACQVRSFGAHPTWNSSYNRKACACADPPTSSIRCEILYLENPENASDFTYACPPANVCVDVPSTECQMDGTGEGPYTCSCR